MTTPTNTPPSLDYSIDPTYATAPAQSPLDSMEADMSADSPSYASTFDERDPNIGMIIAEEVDLLTGPDRSSCNVGRTEQKIRLGAGVVLLTAAAFAPVSRGWRIGFAALGAVELVTGARRYCPLWQALGINTNRPAAE